MEGPAEEWLEKMLRQHHLVQQHQQYYLDQKNHQQQQQQQEQHGQQQNQQRQELFRYRQQQHQHQHRQYHLQQQHEIFWRQQHQQHYRQQQQQQQQQHLQHYQLETAKKTSEALGEARADRDEAPAKMSSVPPSSQTTLKPKSFSEYSMVMLSVSQPIFREVLSTQEAQLDDMEKGMFRKPAQKLVEEELKRPVEESEIPRQPMQAAQPRPCPPVEGAGGDEMGVLGEEQVVEDCVASYEKQRPPFWEDSKKLFEWWRPLAEGAEQENSITRLDFPFDDDSGVLSGGRLVLEDGEQAPPPLLQQQQELLGPTPQEPWPPPVMAAEHGSGAGSSGESRLERGRKDTVVDGGCCGDDGDRLSNGNGLSDTTDGGDWERAGIGTGARSKAFLGCEVAGRHLTRLRRARVRET